VGTGQLKWAKGSSSRQWAVDNKQVAEGSGL
jgi:hypothetical protein